MVCLDFLVSLAFLVAPVFSRFSCSLTFLVFLILSFSGCSFFLAFLVFFSFFSLSLLFYWLSCSVSFDCSLHFVGLLFETLCFCLVRGSATTVLLFINARLKKCTSACEFVQMLMLILGISTYVSDTWYTGTICSSSVLKNLPTYSAGLHLQRFRDPHLTSSTCHHSKMGFYKKKARLT